MGTPQAKFPPEIVIYRITDRQGLVTVPDWVCRQCSLTVAAVEQACRRADIPPEAIDVRPWLVYLSEAWRQGARHPPVVLINGRLYSQEVVPDVGELTTHLRRLTEGSVPSGGRL